MFGGSDIFVLIIVFLAILTVFLGVKTVPQGYNWTVERFGRYTRMLRPGLNLEVPFIDRIGRKMNVMEQVIDVPEQEVITEDSASVASRWHRVLPANGEDAAIVTGLTVSRESCYCALRDIGYWRGCQRAFFYHHLPRPALFPVK